MTSTVTLALRARNSNRVKPKYQICLIHPFDPRGEKVGGLETDIRDFITFHPDDTDLLFIGVDLQRRSQGRRITGSLFGGALSIFTDPAILGPAGARSRPQYPHITDRSVLRRYRAISA